VLTVTVVCSSTPAAVASCPITKVQTLTQKAQRKAHVLAVQQHTNFQQQQQQISREQQQQLKELQQKLNDALSLLKDATGERDELEVAYTASLSACV